MWADEVGDVDMMPAEVGEGGGWAPGTIPICMSKKGQYAGQEWLLTSTSPVCITGSSELQLKCLCSPPHHLSISSSWTRWMGRASQSPKQSKTNKQKTKQKPMSTNLEGITVPCLPFHIVSVAPSWGFSLWYLSFSLLLLSLSGKSEISKHF
jgi:hypothetical protein